MSTYKTLEDIFDNGLLSEAKQRGNIAEANKLQQRIRAAQINSEFAIMQLQKPWEDNKIVNYGYAIMQPEMNGALVFNDVGTGSCPTCHGTGTVPWRERSFDNSFKTHLIKCPNKKFHPISDVDIGLGEPFDLEWQKDYNEALDALTAEGIVGYKE